MDHTELARICEAVLFAAGEPVETERLSFATETDPDEVRAVLRELMDRYAFERRGIQTQLTTIAARVPQWRS